jgi:prolyl-tRNA synthetase
VPPRLAALQAVLVVVKDDDDGGVGRAARSLEAELAAAGVRVRVDDRVATPFGRRATDWELKGVPVRVELGPRDLAEGTAVVVRRDTGTKTPTPIAALAGGLPELLDAIQSDLLAEATATRDARTMDCDDLDDVLEAVRHGFARVPWRLVDPAALARLGEAAATVRCVQRPDGGLPASLEDPDNVAIVARAY